MANKRTSPRPSPSQGEGGNAFPKAERNRLIRAIHTAQRELGIDDDTYRDILESETGKRSCSALDAAGLMAVIERFRAMGFKPKGKPGRKLSPKTRGTQASEDQRAKIRALWIECAKAGAVRNRYEDGLNAFVKRMTKVERVDWLVRADHCNTVIEALKQMLERGNEASDR